MSDNTYYIERREDGRYKVLKEGGQRASAVTATQREAIQEAKRLDPEATLHVARVRDIGPGPDKFRKI